MDLIQIVEILKQAKHVLIGAHVNPDGDAIGAMTGVAHILEGLKIPHTVLMEESDPKMSYMLEHVNIAHEYTGSYDCFVSVDCGDLKRLGKFSPYFENAKQTINIDHHRTNEQFATYNHVEPDASSSCEIIYNLFKVSGVKMTKELAEALYTGLVTDTGGFMHPCTHASTLMAAADLISYPIDYSTIYHKLIHEKSLQALKVQNLAISRIQVIADGKAYLSYITKEDMEQIGASKHDLEGVINAIRNIEGAQIAALIYPLGEANTFKLSTRSIAPYDVAKVCQSFGGGGHQRAAGATLIGELKELMKQVEEALTSCVREGRD